MRSIGSLIMSIIWCALGKLAPAQTPPAFHSQIPNAQAQNARAQNARAQLPGVAVAPHIVVLTPTRPTGRLTIFNPLGTTAELSLELRYGFVTNDSAGHTIVHLQPPEKQTTHTNDDAPNPITALNTHDASAHSAPAHDASATQWITPYPRTFTLKPGASQVIHLTAKPPATIPPGEYWTRLIIHARTPTPPLPTRNDTDSTVRIGIALEMSTIIPIFYRTGNVTTGIAIDSLTTTHTTDSITVHTTLRRTGNSAYIGTARLTLTDATGDTITNTLKRLAVYTTLSPHWSIPAPPKAKPGPYQLTLLLTTNRPDAPKGTILRAPATSRTITNITR
jgi:hypothetical protein